MIDDRKHLTAREVEKLLDATKGSANEARDRCLLLLMFRHGLRVSEACRPKLDQQTLPMQLTTMRDYARKRKWTVSVEVKDVGSGATARPKREALMAAARRREIEL